MGEEKKIERSSQFQNPIGAIKEQFTKPESLSTEHVNQV
jgi:hypothetical protein